MKILFLDDDPGRIRKARLQFANDFLIEAETAEQAIEMLERESPFDLVSLDHDLGGNIYCPSDEVSGYAVAKYISSMPKDKLPGRVIIHSFNPVGAENMINVLTDIVPITQQPFDFTT